MKFFQTVNAIRAGERARRDVWAPDVWICWMPPRVVPADDVSERTRKFVPTGEISVGDYLVMYTADKVWQPGWSPNTDDAVADDWKIVVAPARPSPGCDGDSGCMAAPSLRCDCSRCHGEDADEIFHSCLKHRFATEESHERVRGRRVYWVRA